jgi:RNA polymerase sigma-B factor
VDGEERRAAEDALFAVLRDPQRSDAEHQAARDELVLMHIPLVNYIARPYQGRGIPREELTQVGIEGMIGTIDRFDPSTGNAFSTYATPSISGAIRHYLRDRSTIIRIPRDAQQNRARVLRAAEGFTDEHGRSPTIDELSALTGLETTEVLEALESAYAWEPDALDTELPLASTSSQAEFTLVEDRSALADALSHLKPDQRYVIVQRFLNGRTQADVAQDLGCTQMTVSRLQRSALTALKDVLGEDYLLS